MSRDEIIQQLLIETLHQIVEQGRTSWLLGILEHGFAGYRHLADADLEAAARRFGIARTPSLEDDVLDHDDHHDEHAAEIAFAARYAGIPGSLVGNWALDTD